MTGGARRASEAGRFSMTAAQRMAVRRGSRGKRIAILAAILMVVPVLGVLAFATTKPDNFRIERATAIKAPPERIFAAIDDFRAWQGWSPYEKLDPEMKRSLSGAASGKGAVYEWDGNGKVGAGRMEIAEAAPPSRITINLDFTRPMESRNIVEFILVPKGEVTNVTWAMHGPSPYVTKVMTVFVDMDEMVGNDFEAGLANLKALAER